MQQRLAMFAVLVERETTMRDQPCRWWTYLDGGAHLGSFSLMAKQLFPSAVFHLIEPQPACIPSLRKTCRANSFHLHECALSDTNEKLSLDCSDAPSTGAHIAEEGISV